MTAKNPALDLGQLRGALESAGRPWEMSYTSITALTEDEREIRLGVPIEPGIDAGQLESLREADAAKISAARADLVGAPASFDLRNVGGVNYSTAIRDQGSCGSCVAFGVAGAMEGVVRFTKRAADLAIDLSEAHLFYCHGRAAGARCSTGWWPDQALNAATDKGVTFEEYYPYRAGDQDCTGLHAEWQNKRANVTEWQLLNGDAAAMKSHLATHGALAACMYVYQDFFSYRSGVYRHVTGELAGGHCITLIGYDDGQGCWIGKNSWGPGWGDAGHFRVAYGECRIESYQTCGIKGVDLHAWLPNQQILALWSNEHDANVWAYGSSRGWLKCDGAAVSTNAAMISELAAAKATNRQVGIREDSGLVSQVYVW